MNKPPCQTLLAWLRANLGKKCLAPLTGTDAKALAAAVHIIELYSYDRDQSVLDAFRLVVGRMQPKCQYFAYHAIAHVMEWSDRAPLWRQAGLLPLENIPRCDAEPQPAKHWLKKGPSYVFRWQCPACGESNTDDFGGTLPAQLPPRTLPCVTCSTHIALPPVPSDLL